MKWFVVLVVVAACGKPAYQRKLEERITNLEADVARLSAPKTDTAAPKADVPPTADATNWHCDSTTCVRAKADCKAADCKESPTAYCGVVTADGKSKLGCAPTLDACTKAAGGDCIRAM